MGEYTLSVGDAIQLLLVNHLIIGCDLVGLWSSYLSVYKLNAPCRGGQGNIGICAGSSEIG